LVEPEDGGFGNLPNPHMLGLSTTLNPKMVGLMVH